MPEPNVDANAVESSATEVEEGTEESAASEETEETSEESTEESLTSEKGGEDTRYDKIPRFQQLIKDAKDKDSRIKELEDLINSGDGEEEIVEDRQPQRQVQSQQLPAQQVDFRSQVVQKLVKAGYDQRTIEDMVDMVNEIVGNRVSATEGRLTEFEIGQRTDSFRARHKDFSREQEMKMHKLWKSYSKELRQAIASAPDGLDYLYDKIQGKNPKLPGKKVGSSNLGKTKTTPGSTGKKTWTRKELRDMEDDEYTKLKPELDLAEKEGRII